MMATAPVTTPPGPGDGATPARRGPVAARSARSFEHSLRDARRQQPDHGADLARSERSRPEERSRDDDVRAGRTAAHDTRRDPATAPDDATTSATEATDATDACEGTGSPVTDTGAEASADTASSSTTTADHVPTAPRAASVAAEGRPTAVPVVTAAEAKGQTASAGPATAGGAAGTSAPSAPAGVLAGTAAGAGAGATAGEASTAEVRTGTPASGGEVSSASTATSPTTPRAGLLDSPAAGVTHDTPATATTTATTTATSLPGGAGPRHGAAAAGGVLTGVTLSSPETARGPHVPVVPGDGPQPGTLPSMAGMPSPTAAVPPTVPPSPGGTTVPVWMQQAVQAQLTGRLVAGARDSENGSVHRLTLHLHPADLGAVQVVASMDDGTVSLQLLAGNPVTREAMRAALAGLRSDLAAAGLHGTQLDVSDQPPGRQSLPNPDGGMPDGSARSFTGGSEGRAAAVGRAGDGRVITPVGSGVPTGPAVTSQGVDLHL